MHGLRSVAGAHDEVRTPWHELPTPERDLSTISIRPNDALMTQRSPVSGAKRLRWFLAPPFGVFIRRSAPALARALPDLRPDEKKERQMWWGKSQPATVRVLAAAYAKPFIVSQRSDYFRQANKHLTLVWLKHLYTRMWSNGRTPEGTVEPLPYYSELLNECAVHRPNY